MSTLLARRVYLCDHLALECDTLFTYTGGMSPFETPLERDLVTLLYRYARAERISQAELAKASGITREAMSSYINGHRPMPLRVLIASCERVGVSLDDLVHEVSQSE